MPLVHSSSQPAFKQNVRTLMHEVGESPHVKSRAQALAIAYATQRRAKRAFGGPGMSMGQMPWFARSEARGMVHSGPIMSGVAGRTDHIPLNVAAGSYVLPADHVSHLGQNNTAAGFTRLNNMFSSGPFGTALPKMGHGAGLPRAPGMPRQMGFWAGGSPILLFEGGVAHHGDDSESVPIMAAGGEYVIPPHIVKNIGHGSIKEGHRILDGWVLDVRNQHKRKLASLPGPAK
jgi:hypothetical protein